MKKLNLLLYLLLVVNSAFSQNRPASNLTIFSENGDKFYLVVNGEKQNNLPQTSVRAENIVASNCNVQILFLDKTLKMISQNVMVTRDDGIFMDTSYKLKRKSKEKIVLRYFSMTPILVPINNYPPDVRVINDNPPVRGGDGVNINVNVGGVQVNGTVPTRSPRHDRGNHQENQGRGCAGNYEMNTRDFADALAIIKSKTFDDSELTMAKQIIPTNCLSLDQIAQIAKIFNNDDVRLDFIEFAYDYCTTPRNYFKLEPTLVFMGTKEKFGVFLKSKN